MSPLFPHSPKPSGSANNHAYIPPGVQQAMDRQMQSMPAHLKKYAAGQGGYVPKHAEQAIAAHLSKAAPGYMKEYTGAYVHQNVVAPGAAKHVSPISTMRPTMTADPLNQSHSGEVPGAQADARFLNLFQADTQHGASPQVIRPGEPYAAAPSQSQPMFQPQGQPGPQPASPELPGMQQPTGPSPYDFITNPAAPAPPTRSFSLGGNSTGRRVMIALAGLTVLLILFVGAKSLLSGGTDATESFVSVAQQQQELARVAATGMMQASDQSVKNFAATANLSLTSGQQELISFLGSHGVKVSTKQLGLLQSAKTDEQLKSAVSTSTFDATFKTVMQTELTTYAQTVKKTYDLTKNKQARQLLNADYSGAKLLLQQMNQP